MDNTGAVQHVPCQISFPSSSSSSSSSRSRPDSPPLNNARTAPQATAVPRDPLEPHYFRLPAASVNARRDSTTPLQDRTDEAAPRDVEFVGPFVARTEDSARRVRRQVVEARKRGVRVQDAVEDALRGQEEVVSPAEMEERQGWADEDSSPSMEERQTSAEEECYTGNQNLSCYPTNTTTVAQGTWSKVSRRWAQ